MRRVDYHQFRPALSCSKSQDANFKKSGISFPLLEFHPNEMISAVKNRKFFFPFVWVGSWVLGVIALGETLGTVALWTKRVSTCFNFDRDWNIEMTTWIFTWPLSDSECQRLHTNDTRMNRGGAEYANAGKNGCISCLVPKTPEKNFEPFWTGTPIFPSNLNLSLLLLAVAF